MGSSEFTCTIGSNESVMGRTEMKSGTTELTTERTEMAKGRTYYTELATDRGELKWAGLDDNLQD
jgi:hypothetical protein